MKKTSLSFYLILSGVILIAQFAGCVSGGVSNSAAHLEETQTLFDAAKFTGAATKSPYEFFSAEIYLRKAKDEMELGNDKLADIYLNMAHEKAQKAYNNAKRYKRIK